MNNMIDREAKEHHRWQNKIDRRIRRKMRRLERRAQLKCFWTWPLGHYYQYGDPEQSKFGTFRYITHGYCVGCNKHKLRG